jgi:hypothetical protein
MRQGKADKGRAPQPRKPAAPRGAPSAPETPARQPPRTRTRQAPARARPRPHRPPTRGTTTLHFIARFHFIAPAGLWPRPRSDGTSQEPSLLGRLRRRRRSWQVPGDTHNFRWAVGERTSHQPRRCHAPRTPARRGPHPRRPPRASNGAEERQPGRRPAPARPPGPRTGIPWPARPPAAAPPHPGMKAQPAPKPGTARQNPRPGGQAPVSGVRPESGTPATRTGHQCLNRHATVLKQ